MSECEHDSERRAKPSIIIDDEANTFVGAVNPNYAVKYATWSETAGMWEDNGIFSDVSAQH